MVVFIAFYLILQCKRDYCVGGCMRKRLNVLVSVHCSYQTAQNQKKEYFEGGKKHYSLTGALTDWDHRKNVF